MSTPVSPTPPPPAWVPRLLQSTKGRDESLVQHIQHEATTFLDTLQQATQTFMHVEIDPLLTKKNTPRSTSLPLWHGYTTFTDSRNFSLWLRLTVPTHPYDPVTLALLITPWLESPGHSTPPLWSQALTAPGPIDWMAAVNAWTTWFHTYQTLPDSRRAAFITSPTAPTEPFDWSVLTPFSGFFIALCLVIIEIHAFLTAHPH